MCHKDDTSKAFECLVYVAGTAICIEQPHPKVPAVVTTDKGEVFKFGTIKQALRLVADLDRG